MNILVVDDDEALGNIVRLVLEKLGYRVETIVSAVEAAVKMVAAPWDLIVLDWELPDGNGIELCRSYRDCGGLAPVLMMTGRNSIEDKETGLEAGADDYITKPFELRELSARVKSLLRRANQYSPQAALKELGKGSLIAGRYSLSEQLAQGGMAAIWLAHDNIEERKVVIKIAHGHLLGTPELTKRFDLEWRLLSTVQDRNVVSFLDAGTLSSGTPFLVMEYIKGKSLRNLLGQVKELDIQNVVETMIEVMSGLEAIHKQGIVHRDLKLENIIIEDDGAYPEAIKIVDFGLAKIMELGERLTSENLVVGTLEYMSPEQLRNQAVDGRTDIYAAGVLLYELITKTTPFRCSSPEQMMAKHLSGYPDPPSTLRKDTPPELDRITLKALSKQPEERFQTAAEMKTALLSLLPGLKNPTNQ